MTHPAATPTAEQVEALIKAHCYTINGDALYGASRAATAILAALAPTERACPDCSDLVGHTIPCIVPHPAPAERAEAVPDGTAFLDGKDEAADSVLEMLATALGLDTFEPKDGTETWEGDVSATLYGILHAAGVRDEDTGTIAKAAPTRAGALDAAGAKGKP